MTESNKAFMDALESMLPFLCIAAFGGAYGVIKRGFSSFKEFLVSMMASVLAGFVTCACLQGFEANIYLIAAGCAISGALGDRAIQVFQQRFVSVFSPKCNSTDSDDRPGE